jgi:hypothetical protein
MTAQVEFGAAQALTRAKYARTASEISLRDVGPSKVALIRKALQRGCYFGAWTNTTYLYQLLAGHVGIPSMNVKRRVSVHCSAWTIQRAGLPQEAEKALLDLQSADKVAAEVSGDTDSLNRHRVWESYNNLNVHLTQIKSLERLEEVMQMYASTDDYKRRSREAVEYLKLGASFVAEVTL